MKGFIAMRRHKMKVRLISIIAILFSLIFSFPNDSFPKGGGGSYRGGSGKSHKGSHYSNPATGNHYNRKGKTSQSSSLTGKKNYKPSSKYSSRSNYHPSVQRDSKGKIVRSESAKEDFLKSHGYTKMPKGYQVDHIIPLYAGGADHPSNMQLLTTAEHKAKTKADYQKYGR
jgi:hypothetical protein